MVRAKANLDKLDQYEIRVRVRVWINGVSIRKKV